MKNKLGFGRFFQINNPIIYLFFLLAGCVVDLGDQLIKDMENSYLHADKNNSREAQKVATNNVVKRYFVPGMKADDAFEMLRVLMQQGFEVSEYRHQGARSWPNGEFKAYFDDATRHNMENRYAINESGFTARKNYRTEKLIVHKRVVIGFRVLDGSGEISGVEGDVWADSI